MYADIVIDISHENVNRSFTYEVPGDMENLVKVGTAVKIPFGKSDKEHRGYVIGLKEHAESEYPIKKIISPADKDRNINDEFIELASWVAEHWGCTFNKALETVTPIRKRIRRKKGVEYRQPIEPDLGYVLNEPNEEQSKVISHFENDYSLGIRKIYLLHGITGSGKTDVYIHIAKHIISLGKKVIYLIPEIGLTYQTISRLNAEFANRVAVVHSRLSDGEKYDQFRRCEDGDADIIVGPRTALFAPFSHIGLIIIDEEHDSAYKNENIPRYNSRDMAIKRAEMHNASVLLGSATPSMDSYSKAADGLYTLLELKNRANGKAVLPEVKIIDMREELHKGNRSVFSGELETCIRDRLGKGQQTILFLNRRGYSNFVSCRSCGYVIKCPHCDVSLTAHMGHVLRCHYCGYQIASVNKCPSCGSPYIGEFGIGTEKLELLTKKKFPEAKVARLDTDTARNKNLSEETIVKMKNREIDILIGTQMVVKGHDFPNVTLVGIVAADTSLFASDYSSCENTFQLITQASGRAGRGNIHGDVIIQSFKPDHYAVTLAANQDYKAFYEHEIQYRKMLHYPPAYHIMTVQASSMDEPGLIKYAEKLTRLLNNAGKEFNAEVIGPVSPSVYKVKDYYRKLTYVKHTDYQILLKLKSKLESDAEMNNKEHKNALVSLVYDFS